MSLIKNSVMVALAALSIPTLEASAQAASNQPEISEQQRQDYNKIHNDLQDALDQVVRKSLTNFSPISDLERQPLSVPDSLFSYDFDAKPTTFASMSIVDGSRSGFSRQEAQLDLSMLVPVGLSFSTAYATDSKTPLYTSKRLIVPLSFISDGNRPSFAAFLGEVKLDKDFVPNGTELSSKQLGFQLSLGDSQSPIGGVLEFTLPLSGDYVTMWRFSPALKHFAGTTSLDAKTIVLDFTDDTSRFETSYNLAHKIPLLRLSDSNLSLTPFAAYREISTINAMPTASLDVKREKSYGVDCTIELDNKSKFNFIVGYDPKLGKYFTGAVSLILNRD